MEQGTDYHADENGSTALIKYGFIKYVQLLRLRGYRVKDLE